MAEKTASDYDLKPCPFCGGEAETVYAPHDYNRWAVVCRECGATVEAQVWASIANYENDKAVTAWNRRV